MGLPMWISSATMHWIFAKRLRCHTEANPPQKSEADIIASCPLKREASMSNNEYRNACLAIQKVKSEKAARTAAARSAP